MKNEDKFQLYMYYLIFTEQFDRILLRIYM